MQITPNFQTLDCHFFIETKDSRQNDKKSYSFKKNNVIIVLSLKFL